MMIALLIALSPLVTQTALAASASDGLLAIFEGFARRHLRDQSYSLGPAWRDSNGGYKPMRVLQTVADPVQECSGATTDSFTADGVTVSYQVSIPTSFDVPTGICLWMSADLAAIDINFNPTTNQPITPNQQVASGVTCSQCFAYIGMDFAFSMSCTTSGCTFGFSTGGGIELSAILALSNPSFSESTPPANIIAPPQDPANIPLSSYTTLFSSDGFFISYVPAMQVTASGTGSATGTETLTAVFETDASMEVGLNAAGQFVEGFSGAITMTLPTLSGTGLTISDASLELIVNATVYWSMGYSLAGVGASIDFMTPLITNYTFGVTPSGSGIACSSGEAFILDSSLQSIDLILGTSIPIPLDMPFPPVVIYSDTAGTQCLGTAPAVTTPVSSPASSPVTSPTGGTPTAGTPTAGTPTAGTPTAGTPTAGTPTAGTPTVSTPTTVSSAGSASASSSAGISSGGIAAAIIIPILFIAAMAGFGYYWVYIRKPASDSDSTGSTTETKKSTTTTTTTVVVEIPEILRTSAINESFSSVTSNPMTNA